MLNKIIPFILILLIFSCTEEKQKVTNAKKAKKIKVIKKVKKEPQPDLINNKNVVERLTAYGKENKETIADIYTSKGKVRVRLFKDTPLHRANFVLLAKSGYYDHCYFSRVSKNFMAQFGGSYNDHQREVQKKIGVYTIPAEMSHHHFHRKGALAAARNYTNNPDKRSAMDEAYFVEGVTFSGYALDKYELDNHYKYTQTQRDYYKKTPGAAHIDGEHTVFGVIIKGFSTIPKLTNVDTDSQEWPTTNLYVDSVKVIK
jgi:peptidyl-prolyl cis-trans isomerase B (cyclophilin B)